MKAHGETHGDVPGAKRKRSEDELKKFDADFVKVDQATLFELMMVRCVPPWVGGGPVTGCKLFRC